MMKKAIFLAHLFVLLIGAARAEDAVAATLRCGWFDNPTPANASLHDKDGEWTIAVQGGHQAKGDWPPAFKPAQWVRYGSGNYGFGCACLKVTVDAEEKNVVAILSAQAKPLAACRRDAAIKGVEKKLK